MTQPLVTCLCLTRNRQEFLKRAVQCFISQTYQNKELLIVADSVEDVGGRADGTGKLGVGADVLMDLWPKGTFPIDALSIQIENQRLKIGEKRNRGCESARGQLIAFFDDDDFSAPGRLASQVAELELTRKAVTGFTGMKFTDGNAWWQFRIGQGFVIGSSLLFLRSWWAQHKFLDVQVGEEAGFCHAAAEVNQLAEVPDLNLMYATIHEGNTSMKDPRNYPHKPSPWVELPGFKWK